MQTTWKLAFTAVAVAALAACGGGNDDTLPEPAPSPNPGGDLLDVTKVDGRRYLGKSAAASHIKTLPATLPAAGQVVALGPLPESETWIDYTPGKPVRVAAGRDIPATQTVAQTQQALTWRTLVTGQSVGSLTFSAEGALGLRLGLLVEALPDTALIQLSSPNNGNTVFEISGAEVNALLAANQAAGDHTAAGRTWWTPNLGGSEVTLQVTLPQGASPASLAVSVPTLSHTFADVDLVEAQTKNIGTAQSCNLDVNCYTNLSNERDAVARMTFVKEGSGYLCTGTLLNDAAQSNTPYFLSANHCISVQTVASTLQTDWFFRSSACNNGSLNSASVKRYNGARLLWSRSRNDMTLMVLNDAPPANVWLSGWDASAQGAQTVIGVHHPNGDLAKISAGNLTGYGSCNSDAICNPSSDSGNPFYEVKWTDGTTQGGSSGSSLFSNSGHVLGTLFGGYASCAAQTSPDYYGRLDWGFKNGLNSYLAARTSPVN